VTDGEGEEGSPPSREPDMGPDARFGIMT